MPKSLQAFSAPSQDYVRNRLKNGYLGRITNQNLSSTGIPCLVIFPHRKTSRQRWLQSALTSVLSLEKFIFPNQINNHHIQISSFV